MVGLAPVFNSYGQIYWESFATQNYFDESGLFLSLVWSLPQLLLAILILVIYYYLLHNLIFNIYFFY